MFDTRSVFGPQLVEPIGMEPSDVEPLHTEDLLYSYK